MTTLTITSPTRQFVRSAKDIPADEAARECARLVYGPQAYPTRLTRPQRLGGVEHFAAFVQCPSPVDPTLSTPLGWVTFDLVK